MAEIRDEASLVYLRMRRVFGGRRRRARQGDGSPSDEPFAPGRDPHGIGQVMGRLVRERGWEPTLEKARLAVDWRLVVGDDIAAAHERPAQRPRWSRCVVSRPPGRRTCA
jgi:predicted nucleic acid-binding Zn ribbon protein